MDRQAITGGSRKGSEMYIRMDRQVIEVDQWKHVMKMKFMESISRQKSREWEGLENQRNNMGGAEDRQANWTKTTDG